MMQLISDDITMIDTMKDVTYDVAAVKERFGVGPEKVVELFGLAGDQSDNIPGVPGIGPKNAQRLIEEFGSVEGVLANVEKVRNPKTRESIRTFAEQARMSRELATIRTDAEVDIDLERTRYTGPDNEALKTLFKEFEFSSLLQELKIKEDAVEGRYRLILTGNEFTELLAQLEGVRELAFDIVMSSDAAMRADLTGMALCLSDGEACYIPVGHDYVGMPAQLKANELLKGMAPLFADQKIRKHGHDMKNALILLSRNNVELKGLECDTMVASYILNPARHGFELADVVRDHLSKQIPAAKDIIGSGAKAISFSCHSCGENDGLRLPPG